MADQKQFPSGTGTFLFTDMEGSTKLAQEYANRWEALRARQPFPVMAEVDIDRFHRIQHKRFHKVFEVRLQVHTLVILFA
jgi:hypothetical protein